MGRQLPQAVATHTRAEQIAQEHQDADLVNQSRFYLCADHRHLRQYDQAEQYGQLALAGLEKQHAPDKWVASTLIELGLIASYRGDLAVAQERLETAAALYHQWGQETNYLRALNNLIGVARAARNYDQALAYYEQARPYFQSISGEYDLTMFEAAFGGIMFELGRYSEAEAAFRRANSPYLQKSHYIHQRALVAQCLGNSLLKQQRLDESESCLQASARLWAEASDDLMLANTLGTLGELYAAKGEADTAVSYLEQALFHLAKYPDDAMARRLQTEFTALRDELRRT
ncbi:MAG: tetratricopeptide repeat protein [Anaerolineae bacterium]|nr:tetratricopeptide repeat protein [Anaerolineae bacterium]